MIELGIYTNRRNKKCQDMTGFSKNFKIGGTGHDQYPDMTMEITVLSLLSFKYFKYSIISSLLVLSLIT